MSYCFGPSSGTVCEGLGGGLTSLEEVCPWGWALGFQRLEPFFSLCLPLADQAAIPAAMPCLQAIMDSVPLNPQVQIKYFLP